MDRGEIISRVERRRRWSSEQKVKILSEALEPGATVSAVTETAASPTTDETRERAHKLATSPLGYQAQRYDETKVHPKGTDNADMPSSLLAQTP